jgi:hypothetical protein
MRLKVEMSIPVTLEMEVELDGDDDFTINHVQLAAFQDMPVRKVNENMDDDTVDYILGKLREKS